MKVVQKTGWWVLAGDPSRYAHTFSTPEEALAKLVLSPEDWPNDVDFWLQLSRQASEWDALGRNCDDRKTPYFHNIGLIRHHIDFGRDLEDWQKYDAIDYWFLARLIECLSDYGCLLEYWASERAKSPVTYRITDAAELSFLKLLIPVRRKSNWKKDFLLVRDPWVLEWFGIEHVTLPHPSRKNREVLVSYRELSK